VLIIPANVHAACTSNMGRVYVPFNCNTIQQAVSTANANDTIFVSPGIYHERFIVDKLVHLVGEANTTTVLDGDAGGTVVTITATRVTITGFTITDAGPDSQAVQVRKANFVSINESIISSDIGSGRPLGAGVDLYLSNNTIVDGNTFTHNLYALNITRSAHNRISNNRMVSNNLVGVEIVDSMDNLVFQNTFGNGEEGVELTGSMTSFNNVTRNLVRGTSVAGVFILAHPSDNTLLENTFQFNHIGVNLQNTTLNTYYHNNFFCPSSIQPSCFRHVNHVFPGDGSSDIWDNRSLGGPRGGNYWDNYTGTDTNSDGIGNTNLPADGVDSYPLMSPFGPIRLAIAGIIASPLSGTAPLTVSFQVEVVGTLKPFVYAWNFGDASAVQNSSSPTHVYSQPGNYTAQAFVQDSSGTAELARVNIVVSAKGSSTSLATILEATGLVVGVAAIVGVLYLRRHRAQRRDGSSTTGVSGKKIRK